MTGRSATFSVDSRFQGIPGIALGGYIAGVLAAGWPSAEASFQRPVPVDRELERGDLPTGERCLRGEEGSFLTVRPVTIDPEAPSPIPVERAEEAARASLGGRRHLFPRCFTCGPERAAGDGLRVVVGPVPHSQVVAGAWSASSDLASSDGSLDPRYVWSALDCPSIWALIFVEPPESRFRVVSAKLAVRLLHPVPVGATVVVLAWPIGGEDRSRTAGAAILSTDGAVLAVARHRLVEAKWGVPLGRSAWAQVGPATVSPRLE